MSTQSAKTNAMATKRDALVAKFEKQRKFVQSLQSKEWNEAVHNIVLNGPLIRSPQVQEKVHEAIDLVRQCEVMLDMLPKENYLLEEDDLADMDLVISKAATKAHQAETEVIKEEERRAIEEAL